MDVFTLWCAFGIGIWLIAGWLRLPRYVRCFQHVGYNFGRYRQILAPEAQYNGLFAFFVALYVLGIGWFVVVGLLALSAYLAVSVYVLVFVLAMYFAPRQPLTDQPVTLQARSQRLMFTAFWVELLPVIFGVWVISRASYIPHDSNNSPEAMFIGALAAFSFMAVISAIVGPITFILTRFIVPIANLVNKPVEALLNALKH